MTQKFAVIDLGTNGFRLYIAQSERAGHFDLIHRESNELKLASEGIHRIGDEPFARGVATMKHFSEVLTAHNILIVNAFGTAALRLAENGLLFIETVARETGIKIELISGEREAELIYKGMRWAYPLSISTNSLGENSPKTSSETVVMMDVGGGSVELIVANETGPLWAKSFNIGVAILKQMWHKNDPISAVEIAQIEQFLDESTTDFLAILPDLKPQKCLIACGTLDFMVRQNLSEKGQIWSKDLNFFSFSDDSFTYFTQKLTFLTDKELYALPDVPNDKVEMLAVSFVLMDWLKRRVGSEGIVALAHSMKTGVLLEMSEQR